MADSPVTTLLQMQQNLLTGALMILTAMFPVGGPAFAQPTVIELFTSQGCSSCPPADALLGELAKQPNVIALAYHVDYWDDLGWQDRFAIPEATQRQRQYVEKLAERTAFTPQSVVNGLESFVGSNRRDIATAIAQTHASIPVMVSRQDGDIVIALRDQPDREPYEVNVVAYLSEAATPIGRGENAHRTLNESNIVRAFRRVGAWHGEARQLKWPLASLPRDATHVAVLLQQPRQGGIVGAASMALR